MAMTRMQLRQAQRQAKTVQAAVEYIQARPGRQLSLVQVARGINTTRETLHKHFWEATGLSVVDYLRKYGLISSIKGADRISTAPRGEYLPREFSMKSLKAAEKVWQSYLQATRNAGDAWV